jgi:hypothetical protein
LAQECSHSFLCLRSRAGGFRWRIHAHDGGVANEISYYQLRVYLETGSIGGISLGRSRADRYLTGTRNPQRKEEKKQ